MSDWQDISTAPTDGTRVRVAHSLDPSSLKTSRMFNTTGRFTNGEWVCSAGFVCADGIFRFTPNRWQPEQVPA